MGKKPKGEKMNRRDFISKITIALGTVPIAAKAISQEKMLDKVPATYLPPKKNTDKGFKLFAAGEDLFAGDFVYFNNSCEAVFKVTHPTMDRVCGISMQSVKKNESVTVQCFGISKGNYLPKHKDSNIAQQ